MSRSRSGITLSRVTKFEACEARTLMTGARDLWAYSLTSSLVPAASPAVSITDLGAIESTKSTTNSIRRPAERDYFRFVPTQSGSLTVTIKADEAMKSELRHFQKDGSSRAVLDQQMTFDVKKGQSTVISVTGRETTGEYQLKFKLKPEIVDLEFAEKTVIRGQAVKGEKWYRFKMDEPGRLRAESWIAPETDNIRLEVYDAAYQLLANDDGQFKDDIDMEVDAGGVYFLRVAGRNSDVKIRLTKDTVSEADPVMQGTRKLVDYIGIGNDFITPENPRGINWGYIPNGDWAAMYSNRCEPMAAMGLRRWVLWMPFGRDEIQSHQVEFNGIPQAAESPLRLEQMSLARATGMYDKLCEGFVEATRDFINAGPDREVIAYLGMIVGAPQWTPDGSTDPESPLSIEGLRRRMDAELAPYIEAGCSLAFDATSALPADHWFFEYMQELKANGIRCYIETWPAVGYEHLASENAIALTAQLANYNENTIGPINDNPTTGFNGFIDPKLLTGERQAWLVNRKPDSFETYADWYREVIPQMLENEWIDSVACYVDYFLKAGGTLDQLDREFSNL